MPIHEISTKAPSQPLPKPVDHNRLPDEIFRLFAANPQPTKTAISYETSTPVHLKNPDQ